MTFDLRNLCGISINDIGRSVTYGEALVLVGEIAVHDGSHLASSLAGWERPSSLRDVYAAKHAAAYLNVHRDENTPLFEPDMPWPAKRTESDVTPERRAELVTSLKRRSAFRDRE